MSGISKKLMGTTAAGGGFTAIEDVFSCFLYAGDSASPSPKVNGIDLAGEGGMVWLKSRTGVSPHIVTDTEKPLSSNGGATWLYTNTTDAVIGSVGTGMMTFNSDGFSTIPTGTNVNASGQNYASWTFRKAPRFFDVVTYTGTGAARTVIHNLGTTVGSIIIKRTDTTSNWAVYHRGNTAAPETDFLSLNLTNATADDATYWNDTAPTDSVFTVGTNAAVNASGGTYVAYLYAHDPLGPSGDGSDGLIDCGSYTGNGSATGPVVNLGWEPQWLLVKRSNSTGDWNLIDNMRGFTAGGADAELNPNLSAAESTGTFVSPTATGFQLNTTDAGYNASGGTYVYIAIRRGPMRAPESGTEVFAIDTRDSTAPNHDSGFPVDFAILKGITGGGSSAGQRLTQGKGLTISSTDAEFTQASFDFAFMDGWVSGQTVSSIIYSWMFRRAPEFFDVVAYKGKDTLGAAIPHNLGVAPELVIIKSRNGPAARNWMVALPLVGPDGRQQSLSLNLSSGLINERMFPSGGLLPDENNFYLASENSVNTSSDNYIAYLFATLAGISKVGSYTGNGTSQTINCGFTTGARFILIKRTDSTGDWYVWDTARGIVAANDPHLSLNTTAAEVTTDDSIDPDSSGFIVNQVAATNINVSAASYIFYAVS